MRRHLTRYKWASGLTVKVYQAHRFFTGNHDGQNGDPPGSAPVDNVNPGIGGLPMW